MAEATQQAQNEAAKKQLAENKKVSDKSKVASVEAGKGKPTPTQEENDLAALGAHVIEKEDDGGGADPNAPTQQRSMEAGGGGAYQTRAQAAQHRPPQQARE